MNKYNNILPKNSIILVKLARGYIDYIITTKEYQDKLPLELLSSIDINGKIIDILPYNHNIKTEKLYKSLSTRKSY